MDKLAHLLAEDPTYLFISVLVGLGLILFGKLIKTLVPIPMIGGRGRMLTLRLHTCVDQISIIGLGLAVATLILGVVVLVYPTPMPGSPVH